ncbi:MAG: hypothetical protein HQM10_26310 [Candidatus Riflebacteria bacterium]|nr:hypothetical protein [Candidatus Riflebacteria bacterium]
MKKYLYLLIALLVVSFSLAVSFYFISWIGIKLVFLVVLSTLLFVVFHPLNFKFNLRLSPFAQRADILFLHLLGFVGLGIKASPVHGKVYLRFAGRNFILKGFNFKEKKSPKPTDKTPPDSSSDSLSGSSSPSSSSSSSGKSESEFSEPSESPKFPETPEFSAPEKTSQSSGTSIQTDLSKIPVIDESSDAKSSSLPQSSSLSQETQPFQPTQDSHVTQEPRSPDDIRPSFDNQTPQTFQTHFPSQSDQESKPFNVPGADQSSQTRPFPDISDETEPIVSSVSDSGLSWEQPDFDKSDVNFASDESKGSSESGKPDKITEFIDKLRAMKKKINIILKKIKRYYRYAVIIWNRSSATVKRLLKNLWCSFSLNSTKGIVRYGYSEAHLVGMFHGIAVSIAGVLRNFDISLNFIPSFGKPEFFFKGQTTLRISVFRLLFSFFRLLFEVEVWKGIRDIYKHFKSGSLKSETKK